MATSDPDHLDAPLRTPFGRRPKLGELWHVNVAEGPPPRGTVLRSNWNDGGPISGWWYLIELGTGISSPDYAQLWVPEVNMISPVLRTKVL